MTTVGNPRISRATRSEFMLFSPPSIGEEEIQEVVDTLRSPWITTGPKTRRFEQEFGASISAPSALAGSTEFMQACAASSNGQWAAAGGEDSVLRVWETKNGVAVGVFAQP